MCSFDTTEADVLAFAEFVGEVLGEVANDNRVPKH
jgi:hypothetical protein